MMNNHDKKMRIVWNYFKDKNNKFDNVDIQGWKFLDDKVYILFDLPYSGNEYVLSADLTADEIIDTLLKYIISNLEDIELTIHQYINDLKSKVSER